MGNPKDKYLQDPGNPQEYQERQERQEPPGQVQIHQWPDSCTIHSLLIEIAEEDAWKQLDQKGSTPYDPAPDLQASLERAPGITGAIAQAAGAYEPSDILMEFLDQEMKDLAQTALALLPQEQQKALTLAAAQQFRDGGQTA